MTTEVLIEDAFPAPVPTVEQIKIQDVSPLGESLPLASFCGDMPTSGESGNFYAGLGDLTAKVPLDPVQEQAHKTMLNVCARAKSGDSGAPLEPTSIAALACIKASSPANFQRFRAELKSVNRQVPVAEIDAAVKALKFEDGNARTHHGYAKSLLGRLTVGVWKPVGHDGTLYVVDPETNLWIRKELGQLSMDVAEASDDKENCKKRNDYIAIALHATSLVSSETFFSDAPVGLACPGGFYRIVGDKTIIEPLSPNHRQRVQLSVTPTKQETPLFNAFLHETFASQTEGEETEQVYLMQEIAGAVMLGLMHIYQKVVLFYDSFGRAGKGTLERVLRQLVPPTFVTAVSPFSWNQEYHVATLAGARLNVVGELPDNQSIPAAEFKTIIGGDLITGRHPTKQPFSFKSVATHLFMSNHMINSRDQSEAFFTRWLIVEFPNSRLRLGLAIDPNVAGRIIEKEVPGIAYWALEGAARLLRNRAFSKSQAHERLMLKWRRSNSSLEEFIHECCELSSGQNIRRSELYSAYKMWCIESGRKAFSKSSVKDLMEHNVGLGITWAKLDGYEIFRGLRMATPTGSQHLTDPNF